MFRKSEQDKIHHINIKRGITSHFARMLKILQQKYVPQSDGEEFVYSNDESNNLCNALEAVFLHGLKEPVTTKLSSYVGLATAQDSPVFLDFWAVAEKFTHKNVIVHLKSLRQISTQIGLCRAWIRLALNDGLMESYLHSVIVDGKSLKYFYHSYSYLRDLEQPGILSNYLTGLMSLTFQLSLNSSVLNDWNNSTLQLVSNLSSAPPPVIRPAPPTAQVFSSSKVAHGESRERQQADEGDSEPIIVPRKSSASGQGREKEQAMFNNICDVEAIRRANPAAQDRRMSSTPSDCSSSSRTSCPDPSGFPISSPPQLTMAKSPHLFSRPNDLLQTQARKDDDGTIKDGGSPHITQSSPRASTADLGNTMVKELMMSPPRQRSRRVSEEDSFLISPLGSVASPPSYASPAEKWSKAANLGPLTQSDILKQSRSPSPLKTSANNFVEELSDTQLPWTYHGENERGLSSVPQPKVEDKSEPCDDIYAVSGNSQSPSLQEESIINCRNTNTISDDIGTVKLDPLEQDAILKKVLSEIDLKADRDREARDLADSWTARNQGRQSPFQGSPHLSSNTLVSEATGEVSSKAGEEFSKGQQFKITNEDLTVKESRDTINEKDGEVSSNLDIAIKSNDICSDQRKSQSVDIDILSGETVLGEDNEDECGSGRFGNSLGSMTGWSSEIDPKLNPQKVKEKEDSSRTESFAAMLRSYMPGSSAPDPAVTLDQVIEDLPAIDRGEEDVERSSGHDVPDGQSRKSSGQSKTSDLKQRQDSCLDDFEVLESPSDSLCGQVEANSTRMIYLFRVPQEHGLSHQNFICRGCSRPIGIIYGQPRLCAFDGGLYCYECHENMETYIPSSIVFDWDFRKKKVCNENHKFLTELESQALYDIEKLNCKLYSHVPELQDLKILRQRLCYLKSYLFTCSEKMAESLRQKIWPREHLYDHRDLYSVTDLLQVQAGSLQRLIKELVRFSSQHVYSCALCSQKGYVCEICRNSRIIYAFEVDTTVRCERCKAVYHKTCMTDSLPCPKCERWGRRSHSSIVHDHPEDYGISPAQHSEVPQHSSPSVSTAIP